MNIDNYCSRNSVGTGLLSAAFYEDKIFFEGENVDIEEIIDRNNEFMHRKLYIIDSLKGSGTISNEEFSMLESIYMYEADLFGYSLSANADVCDKCSLIRLSDEALKIDAYRQMLYSCFLGRKDPCMSYHVIDNDTTCPLLTRIHLLTKCLYDIYNEKPQCFIDYCERYEKSVFDTVLVGMMQGLRRSFEREQGARHTVLLKCDDGVVVPIDTLLAQHRRQLVYVDFWASWCPPCVRAMSDAVQLRAEYARRGVVFVYLSVDENEDAWRKALLQLSLVGEDCHNCLVINLKTSKMLADMRIPPIPRYMLYGRNGQLLHSNAPGPHGEAIRKLLDAELERR